MLQRNIEHFFKKRKCEKLEFSGMNWLKFFFLFPTVFIFSFCKNMNPRFSINNRSMRKKLQKQSFADILQNRCS